MKDVRGEHTGGDRVKDYYEMYCTIYYKNKRESHMTIHVWGNSEQDAVNQAKINVKNILYKEGTIVMIECQILDIFPATLEEFVYNALKRNLSGRRKKQGVITLKDMNIYLQDAFGIKNNDIKEIAAGIIMEQDAAGAVSYFKDFLGIAGSMFMGKFGLTPAQVLDYEKQGRLEFAYEEGYGEKKNRYYKPDAYYRKTI